MQAELAGMGDDDADARTYDLTDEIERRLDAGDRAAEKLHASYEHVAELRTTADRLDRIVGWISAGAVLGYLLILAAFIVIDTVPAPWPMWPLSVLAIGGPWWVGAQLGKRASELRDIAVQIDAAVVRGLYAEEYD